MSRRWNMIVGLVAITATLILLPSSVVLVRDSNKKRQAIAYFHATDSLEISRSHILDPVMYQAQEGEVERSKRELQLVVVVSRREEAEATLRVWDSVKTEPLVRRAATSVLVTGVGEARLLDERPADVTLNRVRSPEVFAIRTGIRVIPFSLMLAGGGTVIAAGPGLPDAAFIHDAAERFIREGPSASVAFRLVTAALSADLVAIETLFSVTPGAH